MTTPLRQRALRRRARAALLCAGLWSGAGSALAVGACSVTSTGLAFGAYQPLTFGGTTSADAISNATVSVVCTGIAAGGSYSIGLGAGNHGPGDRISTRYLNHTSSTAHMQFNVYTDPGRVTPVWGTGAIGALLTGSIPAGDSTRSHAVYGKVPAGQNTLRAGSYADSLTMTITYDP